MEGMTCAACQSNVEKCVLKLEGVHTANVSLLSNSMKVDFDETKISQDAIASAIEAIGYKAYVQGKSKEPSSFQSEWEKRQQKSILEQEETKKRLLFSLVLLIPLMLVSMGPMVGLPILTGVENAMLSSITQLLLSLCVLIIQRHFFIRGFKAFFKKASNMDTLVAIGSLASFFYGLYAVYRMAYGFGHGRMDLVHEAMHSLYFESAAMIVTLVGVGKYLEARSKSKTTDALSKLVDLAPKMATILKDGKELLVPASSIVAHDLVLIRPGEKIPVDGIVKKGTGYVNQAAITGESIPVEKGIGDSVLTATINLNGSFHMEALKVGNDTMLSKIIQLVDEAGNSKAPIARIADRVSGIFVPIVLTISVVTAIVWLLLGKDVSFAFSNAIAVLVISCPCALGLATPVAIMVGTGKAAQMGILIKSAESLEELHRMDTIVLDKTGTITCGSPSVHEIYSTTYSEKEFLKLAASLEQGSQHPLGQAIVAKAKSEHLLMDPVDSFVSISGRGLRASLNNKQYLAGNLALMMEEGIDVPLALREKMDAAARLGQTPLLFSEDQKIVGLISLADRVRNQSKDAIQAFKQRGLHVVMLTGDHEKTAQWIANEVGIDEVVSEVLPTDKEKVISNLKAKGRKVIMVGDGINDAPALVSADVGIAIGAGTDIALDSADVILLKDSLLDVVNAIDLSYKVIRNIRMNLFWAFFYNSLGIPVAAGVLYPFFSWQLSPMIGAAMMSLSSVCVVTNANALRFVKPTYIEEETRNEEKGMTKEIKIEGMMCMHCVAHVEKALRAVAGIQDVQVNLENKKAIVTMKEEIADEILKNAIVEQGYEVRSIQTVNA